MPVIEPARHLAPVEQMLDGVEVPDPDGVQGQRLHVHHPTLLVSLVEVPYSIQGVGSDF